MVVAINKKHLRHACAVSLKGWRGASAIAGRRRGGGNPFVRVRICHCHLYQHAPDGWGLAGVRWSWHLVLMALRRYRDGVRSNPISIPHAAGRRCARQNRPKYVVQLWALSREDGATAFSITRRDASTPAAIR